MRTKIKIKTADVTEKKNKENARIILRRCEQTQVKTQQDESQCGEVRWRQCSVTTGRKGRSRHSYLERPWHRCWWRTWSWGWGCCCPRCETWRASPRSGVLGSPRCSGTSIETESEPRRCRGGRAGWRTACRRTPCPRSSLWSCGPEDTWAQTRRDEQFKAETRDTREAVR